jgi:replicative DNA helicase
LEKIETLILRNLIFDPDYSKKVLPYLKGEYFVEKTDKEIYEATDKFIQKFNNQPTIEALNIILSEKIKDNKNLEELNEILGDYKKNINEKSPQDWLLEETEKFCQDQAIRNALIESLEILQNKKSQKKKGEIPYILTDALAISFDNNVGHDFLEDAEQRYEYYHKKENRIPFHIDWLNKITNGGVPNKTLNILMAGVNVGKTLGLCDLAADYLQQGKNVFYATFEMAEEEIAKRIEANSYDISMDDLQDLPKNLFMHKIQKLRDKTSGKLVIKEYPTGNATILDIRNTLHELLLKKNFRPDIIIVDYIGVMASSRIKGNNVGNLYVLGKSIAEELRGLAQETKTRLWTAVQVNRSGYRSSAPDMADIGESFGIAMTADFSIVLVTNDELEELGQYLACQIKNRYGNVTKFKKHVIGVSREKQKLYNIDESLQNDDIDIELIDDIDKLQKKYNDKKSKFTDFKFS